jgi:hypothetical protein
VYLCRHRDTSGLGLAPAFCHERANPAHAFGASMLR